MVVFSFLPYSPITQINVEKLEKESDPRVNLGTKDKNSITEIVMIAGNFQEISLILESIYLVGICLRNTISNQ